MTVTCVVCKKQPIPSDRTRSFHKFPENTDLRQKWMEILEITCIKNSWGVCSDHFSATSFYEQNGYNKSKRRVLPNALPNKPPNTFSTPLHEISNVSMEGGMQTTLLSNAQIHIKRTQEVDSNKNSCSGAEVIGASSSMNESIKIEASVICEATESKRTSFTAGQLSTALSKSNSQSTIAATMDLSHDPPTTYHAAVEQLSTSISSPHSQTSCTATVEHSNDAQNSSHEGDQTGNAHLKRKRTDSDENLRKTKRICFKYGYTMKCLSRDNFADDESWNTFLQYTVTKNNKLKSSRQKNRRKDEKIRSFKELIAVLRKEKHTSVTRYLQSKFLLSPLGLFDGEKNS